MVDRETLGLIWAGNITLWNDARIQALNPSIASKLPAEAIMIGYVEELDPISVIAVLKAALSSFSPEFKTALAAANNQFSNMPPAQRGSAIALEGTTSAGVAFLSVCVPIHSFVCTLGIGGMQH